MEWIRLAQTTPLAGSSKDQNVPARPIKFGRFLPCVSNYWLLRTGSCIQLVPAYRFSMSFLGSTFAITLYQCEMMLYGNDGETTLR
jgi:hypothetical protein